MRKPNPTAKLLNLPEDQQAKLAEWLLGGMPYHAAAKRVKKDFKVSVGLGAFSGFWSAVCAPHLLRRRALSASTATLIAEEAEATPGRFDAATIDLLKQKCFELMANPNAEPKDVHSLMVLVLKARDQDLVARRVVLLEQAAKKAQAAEDVTRSSRTPAEKETAMRAIFGLS